MALYFSVSKDRMGNMVFVFSLLTLWSSGIIEQSNKAILQQNINCDNSITERIIYLRDVFCKAKLKRTQIFTQSYLQLPSDKVYTYVLSVLSCFTIYYYNIIVIRYICPIKYLNSTISSLKPCVSYLSQSFGFWDNK